MVLWPARYEHKSGAQASRYANSGQNCGSAQHGAIRVVLFKVKESGLVPGGGFPIGKPLLLYGRAALAARRKKRGIGYGA